MVASHTGSDAKKSDAIFALFEVTWPCYKKGRG